VVSPLGGSLPDAFMDGEVVASRSEAFKGWIIEDAIERGLARLRARHEHRRTPHGARGRVGPAGIAAPLLAMVTPAGFVRC